MALAGTPRRPVTSGQGIARSGPLPAQPSARTPLVSQGGWTPYGPGGTMGPPVVEGVWHEESRADGRCGRGPRHRRCRVQRQRNTGEQSVRVHRRRQRSRPAGRCTWHRRAMSLPRSTRRRSTTRVSFEYFRCCLLRTLLSTKPFPSKTAAASCSPTWPRTFRRVSDDGLTYTFTIKPGIMYAPPLQDVEVTAQDFIRALEREADPKASSGGYPFYYSVIEGFDDYGAGKADSISGLSAPDDHTLVVKITEPAGDMPWRFAMPATAPIPPNPADPKARPRRGGRTHDELRAVPGRHRPVHVRGQRETWTSPCRRRTRRPSRVTCPAARSSWSATLPTTPRPTVCVPRTRTGSRRRSVGTRPTSSTRSTRGEVDYVADVGDPPANVLQEYSTNPDKQPYLHTYPAERRVRTSR